MLVDKLALQVPDFWQICRERFPQEYNWLVALVRAFRNGGADYIAITSRKQEFQAHSATLGERLGLLRFEEIELDEQYVEWQYRLTDLGRGVLLDPTAHARYLD
jgi:hypothetical protein